MKTADDRLVPYDEFLSICHATTAQFAFLEKAGFRLTKELWPSGDSYKDGFQLTFSSSSVSVIVEYYDMEVVIWFVKDNERISYLFVDHELMANKSGFAGCMFTRNQLARVINRMAEDIRLNYGAILAGDENSWKRMTTLWHAPRTRKKLP